VSLEFESRLPQRRSESRLARRRGRGANILTVVAAALCVGLLIAFIAMPLLGFKVYLITGGSMEGTIPRGALVLSRTVPVASLQTGDIITFVPPEHSAPVTHRIISVEQGPDDSHVLQTKGDANKSADPWRFTLDGPTQARYLAHIPYAGYALASFSITIVRAIIFSLAGLVGIMLVFLHLWRRAGEDRWIGGPRTEAAVAERAVTLDFQPLRRIDRLNARKRVLLR
jgi:signal peptidase